MEFVGPSELRLLKPERQVFVFSAYTVGGSGNPTCITTSSIRCEMWTLAAKLNRESKTRLAPINHITAVWKGAVSGAGQFTATRDDASWPPGQLDGTRRRCVLHINAPQRACPPCNRSEYEI
jgi:hypothetical protein